MVVKLSRGKVDENVIKFLLEAISDLEQRLRKVEKHVDVLIQEIYGFRLLENEESKEEKKVTVIEEREEERSERAKDGSEGGASVETEIKGKKERERTVIPTVKLAL